MSDKVCLLLGLGLSQNVCFNEAPSYSFCYLLGLGGANSWKLLTHILQMEGNSLAYNQGSECLILSRLPVGSINSLR